MNATPLKVVETWPAAQHFSFDYWRKESERNDGRSMIRDSNTNGDAETLSASI